MKSFWSEPILISHKCDTVCLSIISNKLPATSLDVAITTNNLSIFSSALSITGLIVKLVRPVTVHLVVVDQSCHITGATCWSCGLRGALRQSGPLVTERGGRRKNGV